MWKVQLFKLNFDGRESQAVKDVVDSEWLTMGDKTKEFEKSFGEFLGDGVKCTAVSNATAALHMSLLALDIKQGDEVIIPALTFVADINVVRMVGATPVLADCTSFEDWNVSASTILPLAGFSCDMDGIVALCKEKNLFLIEDVAHAPGAMYDGKMCGTFGDVSCFSFFSNKNLSVGEGGMYATKEERLDLAGKALRSHGMSASTLDRRYGRVISYDVTSDVTRSGLNYRIDEMRSAIGLIQLEKLPVANAQRKALFEEYYRLIDAISGVEIPFRVLHNKTSVYHVFPILLDEKLDRIKIIESMKADGIQTSIHYPAFSEFSAFCELGLNDAPIAIEIAKRELTLPMYPNLTFEEVVLVCEALKKAIKEEGF